MDASRIVVVATREGLPPAWRQAVEAAGCTLVACGTVNEVRMLAQRQDVGVVVVEPGFGGDDDPFLVKLLGREVSAARVVLASTPATHESAVAALNAGVFACVTGSGAVEELRSAIEGALVSRRGRMGGDPVGDDADDVRRQLDSEVRKRKFIEEALQTSLRRLEMAYEQVTYSAEELRSEIEQRKRAERALAESESLRRLQAVEAAREHERKRLAEELHDGTLAEIAGAAMDVGFLARRMEAAQVDGLDAELLRLRQRLRDTERALREVVRGIYPSVLTNLGLVAAVRNYLETIATHPISNPTPVEVEFRAMGFAGARLPEQVEVVVYRVIQQGVTNALQHAQATTLGIELRWGEGDLSLLVRDDGVGFDITAPRETPQTGHFGLVNLRDRVEGLGGTIRIESAPGRGTTVAAEVPMEPRAMPEELDTEVSRFRLLNEATGGRREVGPPGEAGRPPGPPAATPRG